MRGVYMYKQVFKIYIVKDTAKYIFRYMAKLNLPVSYLPTSFPHCIIIILNTSTISWLNTDG